MKKYYIGVDLGGTNIAIGVTDEEFNIVVKGSVPTLAQRGGEAIVHDMAELAKKLCTDNGIAMEEIAGVGIASPGTVNPDTGIIEYANNIKFKDFPIVKLFSEEFGIEATKIAIGNDANLAALGEYVAGAAKGAGSSAMLTLGTGVGGGVIIDGKVLTGAHFGGAELGHIVVEYGGRPCTCGRRGCLEAYCSATGLIRLAKEKYEEYPDSVMHQLCSSADEINGKTPFDAKKMGDKAGTEVVDTYISYLACGIGNVINIFQPDVILIGGGVCNQKDYLLLPLIEKVEAEVYGNLKTKIAIASLGNDAGIIGAAALSRGN